MKALRSLVMLGCLSFSGYAFAHEKASVGLLIPEAFCYLYCANFKDMTNIQEEIWKAIPEYEGMYEVSSFGRVRGLTRFRQDGQITKAKIKKPAITFKGYHLVSLWKNNKGYCAHVHRLVAQAFIPNPESKGTVNHKDGNKLNNHITNLEWMTAIENHSHYLNVLRVIRKDLYEKN